MSEKKSVLQAFGGVRGAVLMTIGLVLSAGFYHWLNAGSGEALREVAADLGLEVHEQGQRRQLRGRIGDIGVAVDTTPENRGGDTRWFTDFKVYAPDQPHGRIVGTGLRQKVINSMQGSEGLSIGDPEFDKAVFVEGDPADMLAHLDAEARAAILAATDAGWELQDVTWTARKSGRMTNAGRIRSLLDLGLAAARAARCDDPAAALRNRAETDPSPGVRAAAAAAVRDGGDGVLGGIGGASDPVTPANALQALAEVNTPRSLDAAILLARAGDHRQEVRTRLLGAVFAQERMGEVIDLLGEVGGQVEIAVLSSVEGEHEEAAKAAVAAIESRL